MVVLGEMYVLEALNGGWFGRGMRCVAMGCTFRYDGGLYI